MKYKKTVEVGAIQYDGNIDKVHSFLGRGVASVFAIMQRKFDEKGKLYFEPLESINDIPLYTGDFVVKYSIPIKEKKVLSDKVMRDGVLKEVLRDKEVIVINILSEKEFKKEFVSVDENNKTIKQ